QVNAQVEDFRRGVLNIEKGPFDLGPRLRSTIREYSFPVFDRGYRRAIIVKLYMSQSWMKDSDGEVKTLAFEGAGFAEVYDKHHRLWQIIAREELFNFD